MSDIQENQENNAIIPEVMPTVKAAFHFRPMPIKSKEGTVLIDITNIPAEHLSVIKGKQHYKRPSFETTIPLITDEATITLLGDEAKSSRVLKYLVKLANDEVSSKVSTQVRAIIKRGGEVTADALRFDRLDLYSLAKYANGIQVPKELWTEWKANYIKVMQPILDRPVEKLATAAEIFMGGLVRVESQENFDERMKLLDTLEDYLNKWFLATSPENQEKYGMVREYLDGRFEVYRAPDEEKELSLDDI